MIVQTSAKKKAIAGVIVMVVALLTARPARAQSTGELAPGMLMERGWYPGAVPPIRVVDGRHVVLLLAPESDWIVKFGPFLTLADCGSKVNESSRGSLPDSDYVKRSKWGARVQMTRLASSPTSSRGMCGASFRMVLSASARRANSRLTPQRIS